MTTDLKYYVAKNLAEILRRKGLSQKALAEATGVWPQQINSWIKERDKISTQNIYKIAAALNVDVEELTKDPDSPATDETPSQSEFFNASLFALNRIEQKLDACNKKLENKGSCLFLYEVFFNKFPWGVGVADLDGKIILVNEAICALTGYTHQQLLKMNVIQLYCNPEKRKQLLKAVKDNNQTTHLEIELIRADGNIIWTNLNIKCVVIFDKEYLITLMEDITEIKKALNAPTDTNSK